MDFIWESITDWLKEILISGIVSNLSGMFDSTNEQVGNIIGQVGMTPQSWNSGIFTMIQNLSNTVILPIAGAILTIVMTLELIQLITDRNNLNLSQMSNCIGCRCRSDITSLDITDHNQIFGFTVINRFLVCNQSRDTKLLIHGDLWFYCRDQIICCIYNSFVILPDSFCSTFQCLSKFRKCFLLNMIRYKCQIRIQSDNDWCI